MAHRDRATERMSRRPPQARRSGLSALLLAAALLWVAPAAAAVPMALDCPAVDCGAVLPGAARFEPSKAGGRFAVGLDTAGKPVGWVALSTDLVDIKAYSGKPLVTLVGLDPAGLITGVRVVRHSEPILLVGIPEQKLHDFAAWYVGKHATTRIAVGSSADPAAVAVDVISGATVTALAQNQTIMDSVRALGAAVGVIALQRASRGHFVAEATPWSYARMVEEGIFARLVVTEAEMGGPPEANDAFIDLLFTVLDPPQVGEGLMGAHDYAWMKARLQPDEHLLAVMGNGSSSFKGSGFVRGGIFDRVRFEQGLRSVMFRDTDYFNLSRLAAPDAPDFKEAAVFIVRNGQLDPGAPFELVFTGSRYDGVGGFSRDFRSFKATLRLPPSVFLVQEEASGGGDEIWRQAWRHHRYRVAALLVLLLLVAGVFAARRWSTGKMARLKRLHLAALLLALFGGGLWLRAQPSVTQVMTLVGSLLHGWHWGLFLSEPLLFVSWIFIALVTVVWGRGVYCGWLCPYGALTELLFKAGRLLRLPDLELPERLHRPLRWLRYLVLIVLVATYLYSPEWGERLAEIEPFKTTFFVRPWARSAGLLAWWLALLGWSLLTFRPFCRYLCPLGAALALPSSFRFSGPRRRRFCDRCGICAKGCEPRAIRPDGVIDPRECLSCMECEANYRDREVCPPLVGLDRLTRRAHEQGTEANADKLARLRADMEDWR